MNERICLKPSEWPAIDQQLWQQARVVRSFRTGSSPATNWSERRRHMIEQGYGQFLAYLDRNDLLDPDLPPPARATPANLEGFVEALSARVAPWSVAMLVHAVQRLMAVMAPEADWRWLRLVVHNLKRIAKSQRDKRPHMVAPEQVYQLGISLMQSAGTVSNPYFGATMGRDGMTICLLICCPIRIANLTSMQIGAHLNFDGDRYRLAFEADETKTGRAYESELPPELTVRMDHYLRVERRTFLARGSGEPTRHLWISRWGTPMGEAAIRTQIEKRTNEAFGKHVWPHLFRTIAATGFVDYAPESIMMVADLLGHTNMRTSEKYYILGNGARAHKKVQDTLLNSRTVARERLRAGGRKGGHD